MQKRCFFDILVTSRGPRKPQIGLGIASVLDFFDDRPARPVLQLARQKTGFDTGYETGQACF